MAANKRSAVAYKKMMKSKAVPPFVKERMLRNQIVDILNSQAIENLENHATAVVEALDRPDEVRRVKAL